MHAYQMTHLYRTCTRVWVLNNTFNCHWIFGLKSFITLICMELKSKALWEEEGHLNHCQELTAHCTQLPLTIFHRWGLLPCKLSPNSLFSSVYVWHVENSSSEESPASACECGLSGSQTPVPLHHEPLGSGSCLAVFSRTIHGARSRVKQGKIWAYNPRHVVILTVYMDNLGSLHWDPIHTCLCLAGFPSRFNLKRQSSFCFIIAIDSFECLYQCINK